MASAPISITISPGGNATTTANSLAALSTTQLQALSLALIESIATLSSTQLDTFAQALIAALPTQASGIPNTGQAFISSSGFLEIAQ